MLMLPIAVEKLLVIATGDAKPSIDRQTGQQRTDANGALVWDLEVVLIGNGGAETVRVRIPHKLEVAPGAQLKAVNLTALSWQNGDRSGVSYRAEKIEVLSVPSSGQRS
jgi:hypothetical protein